MCKAFQLIIVLVAHATCQLLSTVWKIIALLAVSNYIGLPAHVHTVQHFLR